MYRNKNLVSLIKEMAFNINMRMTVLNENKKIENKQSHAQRYFGSDPEAASSEINGKGVEPTPGRGSSWSSKRKPRGTDFVNSAFTHKDGRKLIPTSKPATQRTIGGKKVFHKEFYTSDGKLEHHPISSVSVETKDTGKHNDEHALKHIWNHFSQDHGKGANHRTEINKLVRTHGDDAHDHIVNYIHNEISKAEKDERHPLHIKHRDKTEFVHNVHGHGEEDSNVSNHVKERAKSTYHDNLKNSALSFAAMMKSKSFKKAYDDDYEMVPTGAKKGKLNDNAKKFGMKDGTSSATYKSDVVTLRRRGKSEPDKVNRVKFVDENDSQKDLGVSVKKGGGSQIESPDSKGFNVLYSHAIDKHYDENKSGQRDRVSRQHAHKLRQEIADHMDRGERDEATEKLNRLHSHLDSLKGRSTSFTRKVWRAGITGEHKFEGDEGTANTILVQGVSSKRKGKAHKPAKIMSVDDYLDHLHKSGSLTVPQIGGSKHPGKEAQGKSKEAKTLSLRMRVKD